MSLRARLSLIVAVAAAIAVFAVSSAAYLATGRELRQQIDDSLLDRAAAVRIPGSDIRDFFFERGRVGGPSTISQLLTRNGLAVSLPSEEISLPIEEADIAIAQGDGPALFRDVWIDEEVHLRMVTLPVQQLGAIQIARSLREMDSILASLRLRLLLIGAAAVAAAGILGSIVARRALRPVAELTTAAEHVAQTQDLSAKIAIVGEDEVGRLAASFNAMLDALEESRLQQRQLVHDAGHELRTPLTALRTNIEVLARSDELTESDREELLADVKFELAELSGLVGEVIDLATQAEVRESDATDLRLDELVERVAERARRRTGREVRVDSHPALVHGSAAMLERAVGNLLDNAHKWSPDGAAIEVTVEAGKVAVRDHGPGIAPEDRSRVFDRFYRSTNARAMPGSGLGLAIVRQIVGNHGGTVHVERAPGGGAVVGFELPAPAANDS